jgi:opacity protein-like surface antigen/hemolysin activation/secretion protein
MAGVAGAALPISAARGQAFNPTVLAPEAKPPAGGRVVSVPGPRKALEIPKGAERKIVDVRRVTIVGAFPELASVNAAFEQNLRGKRLSLAQIYELVAQLQASYASAFPLASISAPKPDFAGGDVRIAVSDGYIGSIKLGGLDETTLALVQARLQPLIGQRHLTAAEYQRRTMLVGTLAGVSGDFATAPVPGDADSYILVGALVLDRVAGSAVISNRLPKEFGPWEVSNSLALNNALGLGEQVSGSFSSSTDFSRFFDGTSRSQSYSFDSLVPVGDDGLIVSAGYLAARTRPTPGFGAFFPDLLDAGERSVGFFDRAYARATYPLILTRELLLRAQAGYEHIDYQTGVWPLPLGLAYPGLPIFDLARDRYDVFRLISDTVYRVPWIPGATITGAMAYSRGLGGRDESLVYLSGPPLSKLGASPAFNRLNIKARLDLQLPEQFIFTAIGRAQTSFGKPLVVPETFIIDGPEAVSGYGAGTLNVDRGVTARAELTHPVNLAFLGFNHVLMPYVFGSWGSGTRENLQPGAYRHLWASTYGGGVRGNTNFTGTPFGETLALEFGRDISNIPFRETGYRTNLTYVMRFVGDPLTGVTAVSTTGVLKKGPPEAAPVPLLWEGAYAGLNAGYTWDAAPAIRTVGRPIQTNLDGLFSVGDPATAFYPDPPYWYASALGASGRSSAPGGGYSAGAQIGYNLQSNRLVVGLEADAQGANTRSRSGLFTGYVANGLGIQWSDGTVEFQDDTVLTSVRHTKNVDWLSTLRGRAGYLVTPGLLAYGTGGLAVGGVSASSFVQQQWAGSAIGTRLQSSGAVGSYEANRLGWTIGAGLEWMFAPNASLKAELLYYDLGQASYALSPLTTSWPVVATNPAVPSAATNTLMSTASTQFRGDVFRLGLNYHLTAANWDAQSAPPAAFASGFYAGLDAGYVWDARPSVTSVGAPVARNLDDAMFLTDGVEAAAASATGVSRVRANGALGGGQAGYNYVLGNYLLGLEADLQGAGATGRGVFSRSDVPFWIAGSPAGVTSTAISTQKTLDWFGTLRARAGFLVTPSILAYATGGLAFGGLTSVNQIAHLTTGVNDFQSLGSVSHLSASRPGWTIGGGLEWEFAPQMSVKAEYLYYDLGGIGQVRGSVADSATQREAASGSGTPPPVYSSNLASVATSLRAAGQIARIGLNYRFDPSAAFAAGP